MEFKINEFEDVFWRLVNLGMEPTSVAMGAIVKKSSASVSGARKKGVLPHTWLPFLAKHFNKTEVWLLYGVELRMDPPDEYELDIPAQKNALPQVRSNTQ